VDYSVFENVILDIKLIMICAEFFKY